MTKIEMGRVYRTRDGREVRIYATDGGGHKPIHGAIREGESWVVASWLYDGVAALDCNSLIEVRPRIKREVWVNVYPEESGMNTHAHDCKKAANDCAGPSRIACVRLTIDCEEGTGL